MNRWNSLDSVVSIASLSRRPPPAPAPAALHMGRKCWAFSLVLRLAILHASFCLKLLKNNQYHARSLAIVLLIQSAALLAVACLTDFWIAEQGTINEGIHAYERYYGFLSFCQRILAPYKSSFHSYTCSNRFQFPFQVKFVILLFQVLITIY